MKTGWMMIAAILAAGSAQAEVTVCKMADNVRKVSVVHQDNDPAKACDVLYSKDTEKPGEAPVVLWHYNVEVAQCAAKAQGMVDKLNGMGWSCAAEAAAEPATEMPATQQ